MREASPPRNHDQGMPSRTGDDMGTREPLIPQTGPEPHERRPLPEEETYERDREKKRPDEEDHRWRTRETKTGLFTSAWRPQRESCSAFQHEELLLEHEILCDHRSYATGATASRS